MRLDSEDTGANIPRAALIELPHPGFPRTAIAQRTQIEGQQIGQPVPETNRIGHTSAHTPQWRSQSYHHLSLIRLHPNPRSSPPCNWLEARLASSPHQCILQTTLVISIRSRPEVTCL